jgi:outer membrane receptor protein involved in Fe transport
MSFFCLKTQLLLFCFFSTSSLFAQSNIRGTIQDQDGQPLEFVNVLLLEAGDSSLVRGAITNAEGQYLFERIEPGKYLVATNMVGFSNGYSDSFLLQADRPVQLGPLQLERGVTLEEVEITAEKPLYEQKIDRLVVNVENSIVSAGATALQVLERSPGVVVDRLNNSISLQGKDGVNVMINGKISYMPIASLVQFLEGMPADNIKSMELITTPPAHLDAEGNAGYINILLKKRTDEGLNGNYAVSYGYGRGHVSNNSIGVNFRKGRFSLFGNYSFVLNGQEQVFGSTTRTIVDNQSETSKTITNRDPTQRNHNARLGMDYELSDKTILGVLVMGYDNKWSMDALNLNRLSHDSELAQTNSIANEERNQWQHVSGNLNLKHQFSDQAHISFDIDYLDFYNENPTDYVNTILDGDGQFLREQLIESEKVTPIQFYVGSVDFQKKWDNGFTLKLGAKGVTSRFDNDVQVNIQNGNGWMVDPQLTSLSYLNEDIWATYISTDFSLGPKTEIQAGLRYEFTDSQLDTEAEGTVVDREFGRFFPSLFLTHQFSDDFSTGLSYSRRITRPDFDDMAPFVYFIDLSNFFAGNTAIQPSISDGVKLDLRYKSVFFSVQYTYQDSTIALFQQRFDPETRRLIWLAENLKDSRTLSFTLGFPWQITEWWSMRNNAIYFRQQNNTFLDGDPISLSQDYIQVNSTQSFNLSEKISSEISVMYTGPSLDGTLAYESIFMVNAGLNINLGERWGNLRFNINDVLNSFEWTTESVVDTERFNFSGFFDFSQRTFLVSYSRTFGNQKLRALRDRKTGAAEERRRVN